MPRKNKTTDLTIEKDDPDEELYYNDPSLLIVHVGDHMIETTATAEDSVAGNWIRSTVRETRHINRRRSGPLIVSLCAFRGRPEKKSCLDRDPKGSPNQPSNPLKVLSICVAGCKALFYRHIPYDENELPKMRPLQDLFEDKKVVVVGVGIKEIAKKLEKEWGMKIARPVDIRKLAANAYGKGSVYWPTRKKNTVGIEQLGLEELGELALEGIKLEKKPSRVVECDWGEGHHRWSYGGDEMEEQLIMYASRDAFLCYEIAVKCIDMAGGLPSEN